MPITDLSDRESASDRLTILAIAITVALLVWKSSVQYGWLEVTFGRCGVFFWLAALVWAISVTCVIRWQRRWWLLLTAPVVLYPVVAGVVFMAHCVQGDCL
ncbi:hypothetical protein FHS74_003083 [Nitrospirillum iridis]|uniref:Uncharacterized protein n=2 Tax=Nitrospirillum iridis TaxID=765888 RepID=A0A7X0EDA0_9PROT|nr:hypothetical protein [Nitrospirillum iridis]